MDVDGVVMAPGAQFADQALRLAQGVGADQDAAVGMGVQGGEQAVDLAARVGMAEDRQAECGFGDEDVAGDGFEGFAGGIGAALVVAGDDYPLASVGQQDLGGTEDMAGGHIADRDAVHADFFAIGHRRARRGAVAQGHDRQRFLRRPDMAVAAARMIGMAMGDERAFLRDGGIDPGIGRADIDAGGVGFDPVRHCCGRRWNAPLGSARAFILP